MANVKRNMAVNSHVLDVHAIDNDKKVIGQLFMKLSVNWCTTLSVNWCTTLSVNWCTTLSVNWCTTLSVNWCTTLSVNWCTTLLDC